MPIYEYQCDECGQVFEKMKKRSEPEPAECPSCGALDPRRAISQTAFQLKGGGWYVTDYKGGSNKGESVTASSSSKSTGDDPSGSSDGPSTDSSTDSSTTDSKPSGDTAAA